jgi:hypothetical protein
VSSGYGPAPVASRHERAVQSTLEQADEAANGDHRDALSWLGLIETIGDELPDDHQAKRRYWHAAMPPDAHNAQTSGPTPSPHERHRGFAASSSTITTIGVVHAVLNRIRMREPLDDAALLAAQRDLDRQAAQIEGLAALQVLQTDENDLVVLVFGDDEAALERTRQQLGNAFMREHVIPHADGPPERSVTKVVLGYQRAPAA